MKENKPSINYFIPYFDETCPMRAPYQICKGFVEAGWNVEISTIQDSENKKIDMAWDLVPIKKEDGFNKKIRLLKIAVRLLKKRKSEIVISWIWYWHCFALMISKILFDSPYVLVLDTYTHLGSWEVNGYISKLRLQLRYGLVMRNADVILADSPLSFEHAKQHIQGPEILLIPASFWKKDLSDIETKWFRDDFKPQRELIIFYAGQIVERKNIHHLIEAFSCLSERFPLWRLEIRGPANDLSYFDTLKQLVKQYGLNERIYFLPGIYGESLYRRYRSTSIFCLPSRFEGIPTTILEAMYFGGAIIAGKAGHISYQLDNGKCGLLFEPGDVDRLTSHLEILMSSEKKREQYIIKARERFLKNFTWERYFDRIESRLANLLRDKSNCSSIG
jgi:glycosyltransferase involved in cell wall biosynthesis